MKIQFEEVSTFQKELKKLKKRYKSLSEDLKEFQKILSVSPLGNTKHFIVIQQTSVLYIIKARFFCRYLKGSSLRIVYAYFQKENKIQFIELYYKGNKEYEDTSRIKKYIQNHNNIFPKKLK